jgi:23S rRNA pseudouridine1911/1915/1917 synthase
LYEDEDFLVVNKPPFLPTHPSKGHPASTLANFVSAYNLAKGFDGPFRGLNRLDSLTSGVVVTSRNLAAAGATLSDKTYYGVVLGRMKPLSGRIVASIRRVVKTERSAGFLRTGGKL